MREIEAAQPVWRSTQRASLQTRAPHASPPRRPGRGTALGAALGFACGAIFWHAAGLSTLIFTDPRDGGGSSAAPARRAQVGAEALETGSLPTIYRVDPAACTSLELDRHSNRTVVRPCPSDGLALRLDQGDDREDLANLAADYGMR